MSAFWTVIGILLAMAWIAINLTTAYKSSASEMEETFIDGQCVVGMICANIFYAPAWLLKVVKAVVVATIK